MAYGLGQMANSRTQQAECRRQMAGS